MKSFALVLFITNTLLISGCASNITVNMQLQQIQNEKLLARVKVNDLRAPGIAASTRQAAFGTPMGNITFNPPEAELIQNLLEQQLTISLKEKGFRVPQDFECDIVEFGVHTNTTPIYWDVTSTVGLVLKHNGEENKILGTYTERTYVWPGESIIRKSIDESFRMISDELKHLKL